MAYSYPEKKIFLTKLLELFSFIFLLFFRIFRKKQTSRPKNILLIEPFQMGDVLSLTPLLNLLKEHFAEAKIFVLTKKSSGSILHFDSRVSEVFFADFPWSDYGFKKSKLQRWLSLWRSLQKLKSYHFDVGIDTRGDVRSQIVLNYLQCSSVIGYTNYLHSNIFLWGLLLDKKLKKSSEKHRYLWNIELLSLLGVQKLKLSLPSFVPDKSKPSSVFNNYIVLHIGGGWEYKRWQEKKWLSLIDFLLSKNKKVVVVGGEGERSVVEAIQEKSVISDNLVFKITSLEELISLINHTDLFVGLDSGPMNLAVCLNTPVLALFGPGDSEMWHPLSEGSSFIHKKELFGCSPCLQTICHFPLKNCMASIEVSEVINLIKL
ncbi:MAG: glycosyltransferase family 9 protein [Thermonemataceae bacterium]|nr:glycosyltransferase family 9 protein [Thermonemataceae bacterium]